MRRIPDARVLWSESESEACLSSALDFAVSVTNDTNAALSATAYADRYGGVGIINNGGAGRGAFFGGSYLKGIGRTPLIGAGQRDWHSDGLLFVEEAARECVLGRISASELPWGGYAPTSVLDTGRLPDLHYRSSETNINRTLVVVREPVLRLAHFERALLYRGDEDFCGLADERRVNGNVRRAGELLGREELLTKFIEGWFRWAEQCAYQFIHRIPQSSPSTSNVALDGGLIDFGGSRAVPSWSAHVPGANLAPFGTEILEIYRFLHSGGRDVLRRIGRDDDPAALSVFIQRGCERRHAYELVRQFLRLVGYRRSKIDAWLTNPRRLRAMHAALLTLTRRCQARRSYAVDWTEDELDWIMPRFWDRNPPAELRELRSLCKSLGCQEEPLLERLRFRARSRPGLDYDEFNRDVFTALKPHTDGGDYAKQFRRFVTGTTLSNRRDCWHEPEMSAPIGFVAAGNRDYAVFRTPAGLLEACVDQSARERQLEASSPRRIMDLSDSELTFADGEVVPLDAVELSL